MTTTPNVASNKHIDGSGGVGDKTHIIHIEYPQVADIKSVIIITAIGTTLTLLNVLVCIGFCVHRKHRKNKEKKNKQRQKDIEESNEDIVKTIDSISLKDFGSKQKLHRKSVSFQEPEIMRQSPSSSLPSIIMNNEDYYNNTIMKESEL